VVPLTNGNYTVVSQYWNHSEGAVTWGSGTTGIIGAVSAINSLVGQPNDYALATGGVTPLSNGNYVIDSPLVLNQAGAVTFGNGSFGVDGTVYGGNSLMGPAAFEQVGAEKPGEPAAKKHLPLHPPSMAGLHRLLKATMRLSPSAVRTKSPNPPDEQGCGVIAEAAMSDVTRILQSMEQGDPQAAEQLLPLVYEELRRLAAAKMAHEPPGQTLQATALVHEAWLKLAGSNRQEWHGRAHFFGAAAEAMRRILIDKSRRHASQKRGADRTPEELHDSIQVCAPAREILAVHDALDALAAEDPVAAEVVKLRYFVGMTIPEIADALNLSPRSADRHWAFARAWLKRAIEGESHDQ